MQVRLGVVGFGTMGSEIALLGALAGWEVMVYDAYPGIIEKNLKRLAKLTRVLARDKKFFAADKIVDPEGQQVVVERISTTTSIAGLNNCTFIIEAAPEELELKENLCSELAENIGDGTILATNTSSISITQIASWCGHPERVVGMHFFNPPSAMQLVEVIPGHETAPDVTSQAMDVAKAMGRRPVQVKETPGFVVNRILLAMMVEAITLYEEGVASIEDIDLAMKLGAGLPMGPFKLADLVGLDTIHHACEVIYEELGRDKFKPPFALTQRVRAGKLGRKTRGGFYE
jgi:3-hydroxybutyryl-CoA dehydrogenase